jgi:hypothetical protein
MTTVLLVGLLGWVVGVECRLWVNVHRLNEHLEELHEKMDQVVTKDLWSERPAKTGEGRAPFETHPLARLGS